MTSSFALRGNFTRCFVRLLIGFIKFFASSSPIWFCHMQDEERRSPISKIFPLPAETSNRELPEQPNGRNLAFFVAARFRENCFCVVRPVLFGKILLLRAAWQVRFSGCFAEFEKGAPIIPSSGQPGACQHCSVSNR
jgi:hypothetical protein